MIIGTFLALILNFSTVGHGGAYGGAFALYWPMKLMDLPQFWKKDTFSRLREGRSWGATFGIHGGAFQLLLKHFLAKKSRIFEMNVTCILENVSFFQN